jgi:putative transposase
MVAYRRNFVPGGTFFFTVVLADRRSSLLVDYVDSLRTAFRVTRKERPFSIDSIVVLPDHLHAILTLPSDDSDFSGRWRSIKSLFTRQAVARGFSGPRNAKGGYRLWQRRFWEPTIRHEADFERHADYIHYNPVKHGLVSQVIDWRYSSFHRYVRQGVLPADWGGKLVFPARGFGEPWS